ncbi:hypothetical protein [Rhizobium sp. Rhizsp82]|uniref:hypothetical protein n=1 Tax=Rhizobium sp. Rhizsp82 TaxID=3243057 RepID=UPI0039B364C9
MKMGQRPALGARSSSLRQGLDRGVPSWAQWLSSFYADALDVRFTSSDVRSLIIRTHGVNNHLSVALALPDKSRRLLPLLTQRDELVMMAAEAHYGMSRVDDERRVADGGPSAVTLTTQMISDFVRAANTVQALTLAERKRLLERGMTASGALRSLLLKTGKPAPSDEPTGRVIEDIAQHIEEMSDETVAKALLALASQIRTLRILNQERA